MPGLAFAAVADAVNWLDLLDPDREQIDQTVALDLHPRALDQLLAPVVPGNPPRPVLESHGTYVFGVFLIPILDRASGRVYGQEVDLVLTREWILTVRKTPKDGVPFDRQTVEELRDAAHIASPGMIAYYLVDEVAERFLDLTDAINERIDTLEDHVEDWPSDRVRRRLTELRHDLLLVRRTLTPTRDAARRVIDNRIDLDGEELFDRDLELHFADAFDKLLRASEALELSRDLVAGVRDYHQAKVANDQNEVMKRLTVVASVLLVPTFIVGLYGQNFENIPELHWHYGYAYSWAVIITTTVLQLWYYRRKQWI
jgi:magnesium transporter